MCIFVNLVHVKALWVVGMKSKTTVSNFTVTLISISITSFIKICHIRSQVFNDGDLMSSKQNLIFGVHFHLSQSDPTASKVFSHMLPMHDPNSGI